MNHVRVYHPVTDEPFDLPKSRADDLRLNHGWRSHPVDKNAEAAVQTVESGRGSETAPERDWRDIEEEDFERDSIGMVPRGGGRQ